MTDLALLGESLFTSTSELKALLSNRSDLATLEISLSIFLRQLHDALWVPERRESLSGVVFRYFEGSQSAVADFTKLWEVMHRTGTSSILPCLVIRVTGYVLKHLASRAAFSGHASKLAKDLLTEHGKALFQSLIAFNSDASMAACVLDFYAATAAVDRSTGEALLDVFDTGSKALFGLPTNRSELCFETATGESSCLRACWQKLMVSWFETGGVELRLSLLKTPQLIPRLLSTIRNDENFEEVTELLRGLFSSASPKTVLLAIAAPANLAVLARLLHEHQSHEVRIHILSLFESFLDKNNGLLFGIGRLDGTEQSLRNRNLLILAEQLNIFGSMDELQLVLRICDVCPDLPSRFLGQGRFLEAWEASMDVSIRWLTLNKFLEKMAWLRVDSDSVAIDYIDSDIEFLWRPYMPSRSALTRALLHEQPLVCLNALTLLHALLERIIWVIGLVERDLARFESLESVDSHKKQRILVELRSRLVEQVEKAFPDWQTLQGVLNTAIAGKLSIPSVKPKATQLKDDDGPIVGMTKESKSVAVAKEQEASDLNAQLLPADLQPEFLRVSLGCASLYLRLFFTSTPIPDLSTPVDPVKFLAGIFGSEEKQIRLADSLRVSILDFVDAFYRVQAQSSEAWKQFFMFLARCISSAPESHEAVKRILSRTLYGTGLFVGFSQEMEMIVDSLLQNVLPESHWPALLEQLLKASRQDLFEAFGTSPFLASIVEIEELKLIVAEVERSRKSIDCPVTKRARTDGGNDSSNLSGDSEDSNDTDNSESLVGRATTAAPTAKPRLQPEDLPDPETTPSPVLLNRLLSALDVHQFGRLIAAFPADAAWPSAHSQKLKKVSSAELSARLYPEDDKDVWESVAWWIRLLTQLFSDDKLTADGIDYSTLVGSNLLGAILMTALASADTTAREQAGHIVEKIRKALPNSTKFTEALLVYTILEHAKRTISFSDQPRLNTPLALYYAHALYLSLKPSHFMYTHLMSAMGHQFTASLYSVPLWDHLITLQAASKASDSLRSVEPKTYWQEIAWLSRLLEQGCQTPDDLKGPIKSSRALSTLATFLPAIVTNAIAFSKQPIQDIEGPAEASALIKRSRIDTHRESLNAAVAILKFIASLAKRSDLKPLLLEQAAGLKGFLQVLRDTLVCQSVPALQNMQHVLKGALRALE